VRREIVFQRAYILTVHDVALVVKF